MKIKKIILAILIMLCMIPLIIINNKLNEYTTSGVIYQVTNEHWVLVKTTDGHLWEFDGYDYTEGQRVSVVFNSQGTPNKIDDKIVKVL